MLNGSTTQRASWRATSEASARRQVRIWVVVWVILLVVAGCAMPAGAAPVVKIGVIAPFEGIGRPLGYAILPIVRADLAQANADGLLGRYRVALVVLNDDLDPASAAAQARVLAQDPDVMAVLGPFSEDAAAAAVPLLAQAGIPTLLAAPAATPSPSLRSLCPAPAAIQAALRAAAPDATDQPSGATPVIFYPGDAEVAVALLAHGRGAGWVGTLLGGPDLLRPWLPAQAGAAAEGTRALACALPVESPAADELPEAALARAGTGFLLHALAADIQAHGRPTRAGIAAALAMQDLAPGLVWYQVQGGMWVLSGENPVVGVF